MKVIVNGIDRSSECRADTLSLSDDVGRRSTGDIAFTKKNGFNIKSGERVEIYDNDGFLIFGGFAKRPRIRPKGISKEIQVQLVDNTDILERRFVAETYIGELDLNIVKDIHLRYLAEEGIKLGVIASNSGNVVTETKIETTQSELNSGVLSSVEVDVGGTMRLQNISGMPPISSITEDFEGASVITISGDWYKSSFRSYSGTTGLTSPNISNSETAYSDFDVTVREGAIGRLSFYYWVSTEPNEDIFEVWRTTDGFQTKLMEASGVDEVWRYFSVDLPEGSHKITLIYDKDRHGSYGYDSVVVDKIKFDELEGIIYPTQGERIAPKITSLSDTIKSIRIECDNSIPEGTNIEFYYSFDNQETWELAHDNMISRSINGPVGVNIKAVLKTNNTAITPIIREIKYLLDTTTGTTINKAVFNYVPAAQALDELCELSGALWWVTSDKVLHYVARDEFKAPWGISKENSHISNLEVETDITEYRNRQYIRAGQDITDPLTESMKGDGSKKTFQVGLPIAETPVIKKNGVIQSIGIRQKDVNKAFYWAKGDKEITQDQSGISLLSTDVLSVDFKGLFPIIVVAEDQEAIMKMKKVTGDSGLYESVEDNESIDDSDIALEFANSKLRKYAKIKTKITFDTKNKGLQAGQLFPINLTEYEVNDDFLITSVTTTPINDKYVIYSVECVDGEDVGGWENFFKQLAKSSKTYVIRDNEVLIRLASQSESVGFSEIMEYGRYSCKFPTANLQTYFSGPQTLTIDIVYPSTTFYPC